MMKQWSEHIFLFLIANGASIFIPTTFHNYINIDNFVSNKVYFKLSPLIYKDFRVLLAMSRISQLSIQITFHPKIFYKWRRERKMQPVTKTKIKLLRTSTRNKNKLLVKYHFRILVCKCWVRFKIYLLKLY